MLKKPAYKDIFTGHRMLRAPDARSPDALAIFGDASISCLDAALLAQEQARTAIDQAEQNKSKLEAGKQRCIESNCLAELDASLKESDPNEGVDAAIERAESEVRKAREFAGLTDEQVHFCKHRRTVNTQNEFYAKVRSLRDDADDRKAKMQTALARKNIARGTRLEHLLCSTYLMSAFNA